MKATTQNNYETWKVPQDCHIYQYIKAVYNQNKKLYREGKHAMNHLSITCIQGRICLEVDETATSCPQLKLSPISHMSQGTQLKLGPIYN